MQLEQLGSQIESVQDFWRYDNNTPVDQIKMRESIYLFKQGFKPVWEDRRNINGGSWTFRVPKSIGPDVWTRVQLLAIGEKLQSVLDEGKLTEEKQPNSFAVPVVALTGPFTNTSCSRNPGDQICGVGLSVRFNSHLISIWHRESSKQKSIDNILACVLEELPPELAPKPDNYFYKKHADHAGFKAPPELQAVLDSQKKRDEMAKAAAAEKSSGGESGAAAAVPEGTTIPEIKEPVSSE